MYGFAVRPFARSFSGTKTMKTSLVHVNSELILAGAGSVDALKHSLLWHWHGVGGLQHK